MEFSDVVAGRRMVRSFDPARPLPAELRDRLLRNAHRAPSAGGTKGWAFLVLESAADRDRFWALTAEADADDGDPRAAQRRRWLLRMREAPLLIVVWSCEQMYRERYAEPDKGIPADAESPWAVPYWHVDAGFAALLMLLTAVDEGLGACFFGVPPERISAVREGFGVPDGWAPVGVVAAGFPADTGKPAQRHNSRRELSAAVHRGTW